MKSVLEPVEFFQVFVLISVSITLSSPLEMCLASKGCALGLLAVCLYQFKNKHLSELQWWFQNIEKADYRLCTPNAKICMTLYTLHKRVRVR